MHNAKILQKNINFIYPHVKKYSNLDKLPSIAMETMGPIDARAFNFLTDPGHHLTSATGDPREQAILLQEISTALQSFHEICFTGSFICSVDEDTGG